MASYSILAWHICYEELAESALLDIPAEQDGGVTCRFSVCA